MTIPELAKASFCCVRTLEYSFKQIIGMTPKQYIITRRLQQIHITLKEDKTKTIAELTKSYGIVNQGRFAQDYFKFFNEYPSDTKKQSQVVDYSGQ
nr:helix-turn-helix domain-containing protein [Colwellia sp. C2M11]